MSQRGKIKRYILIIEKVEKSYYPTFQEITEFLLDQGFELSHRTFQRDIQEIRYEFGIDVVYNHLHNGYTIKQKDERALQMLYNLFNLQCKSDLIAEILKDGSVGDFICFEHSGDFKGIEHVDVFLRALRERRFIRISHQNYYSTTEKKYTIQPRLLKEFEGRWYLIGIPDFIDELRNFGLDRISKVELLGKTFTRTNESLDVQDQVIGITYSQGTVERIELSFSPDQGKYVKALTLHDSQKIILDNETELRIEIHVRPNFELIQKILMNSYMVKVIEPKWLAEQIKNEAQKILKNYQHEIK